MSDVKSPSDFFKFAKDHGAEHVDMKFCDMFGSWQHCSYPIETLDESIFEDGFGFDGSSIVAAADDWSNDSLRSEDRESDNRVAARRDWPSSCCGAHRDVHPGPARSPRLRGRAAGGCRTSGFLSKAPPFPSTPRSLAHARPSRHATNTSRRYRIATGRSALRRRREAAVRAESAWPPNARRPWRRDHPTGRSTGHPESRPQRHRNEHFRRTVRAARWRGARSARSARRTGTFEVFPVRAHGGASE